MGRGGPAGGAKRGILLQAEEEFRLLLESGLAHDATDAPVTEAVDANVVVPAKPKT